MGNRRRGGPKRGTDWSGVHFDVEVNVGAPTAHINLWTPVTEDQGATVVRVVGEIYVAPTNAALSVEGEFEFRASVGIQVVNRAVGGTGAERNALIEDDLEGREWLWMRHYCFHYVIQGDLGEPANAITGMQQFVTAPDSHIDVRVKRKLDLSQDELLLSIASSGTSNAVTMCGGLRVLMMQA